MEIAGIIISAIGAILTFVFWWKPRQVKNASAIESQNLSKDLNLNTEEKGLPTQIDETVDNEEKDNGVTGIDKQYNINEIKQAYFFDGIKTEIYKLINRPPTSYFIGRTEELDKVKQLTKD